MKSDNIHRLYNYNGTVSIEYEHLPGNLNILHGMFRRYDSNGNLIYQSTKYNRRHHGYYFNYYERNQIAFYLI